MTTRNISGGTVHNMPADLRKALAADPKVLALWEDITPLGRNEFTCWIENAKQIETRNRRVRRTCEELLEGKRRPCCWMGCTHRTDKPVSPSVRWVLERQSKKRDASHI
ncbi:MAG: YdeI/OmpD-associated family protein [Patescibacteria group bacterium]